MLQCYKVHSIFIVPKLDIYKQCLSLKLCLPFRMFCYFLSFLFSYFGLKILSLLVTAILTCFVVGVTCFLLKMGVDSIASKWFVSLFFIYILEFFLLDAFCYWCHTVFYINFFKPDVSIYCKLRLLLNVAMTS